MAITHHTCVVCGAGFSKERTGGRPPKTCSAECHSRHKVRIATEWQKANPERTAEHRKKTWAHYYANNRDREIARSMAYARGPGRDKKRAADMARYARTRGSVTAERFTLDEIYERDGGRCHLCNCKVARRDATVDHLVPVALGGEHTRANVALAHRSCNSSKKTSARNEQLRLIG